jgi:hypothetical protein
MTTQKLMSPSEVNAITRALDPVDAALVHINSILADPERRARCRAHRAVGGFYLIRCDIRLDRDQAARLLTACKAAGWKSVQVVVSLGSVSVTLDNENERTWQSTYERRPLTANHMEEMSA